MARKRERGSGLLYSDLLALDAEQHEEPRAGLRSALQASVGSEDPLAGFAARFGAFFDLGSERTRELLCAAAGVSHGWETMPLAGVELLHFAGGARRAQADCGLVRIAPGVRFPMHRHRGDEWSLVLSGFAEEEGSGAIWAPGDVVHRPAGSVHAFRVAEGQPFVFGVVLEGGIELCEER